MKEETMSPDRMVPACYLSIIRQILLFVALGIEPRALYTLSKCSAMELYQSLHEVPKCDGSLSSQLRLKSVPCHVQLTPVPVSTPPCCTWGYTREWKPKAHNTH